MNEKLLEKLSVYAEIAENDGVPEEAETVRNAIEIIKELEIICKAWMLVESESADNHPCPDYALKAQYRKKAVELTKKAMQG